MSSGRIYKDKNEKFEILQEKEDPSLNDRFNNYLSKYIISPYSKYLLFYQIIMTVIYLVALTIDTLILAFKLRLLLTPNISTLQSIFSFIMIIDIMVKFFIAYRANQTEIVAQEDAENEKMNKLSAKVGIERQETDADANLSKRER